MFPLLQTQIPTTLIMLVLGALLFWFMIVRPARKQMAEQKAKQEEIKAGAQPGARVMLASGLIGTVRHVGERQIILELAPGNEVTVAKQAVAQLLTPDDEDFEYEDEGDVLVDEVGDDADPTGADLASDDEVFAPVISHDQAEPVEVPEGAPDFAAPDQQEPGGSTPIGTDPEGRS